jgi:GNAT superfamily N-acetyltransferase
MTPKRTPAQRTAGRGAPGPRPRLRVLPLTPERWNDFEKLFGPRGACAGCWCMWWRIVGKDWKARGSEGNRRAMKKIVSTGEEPGLLAYDGGEAVGWCAVAPRETFPRLERSRTLARVDDRPVWSVNCFFVARSHRRRGVTSALLRAALAYAKKRGARILEGYPNEPGKRWPDAYAFAGLATAFRKAGFREVARPSQTRRIMRRALR